MGNSNHAPIPEIKYLNEFTIPCMYVYTVNQFN